MAKKEREEMKNCLLNEKRGATNAPKCHNTELKRINVSPALKELQERIDLSRRKTKYGLIGRLILANEALKTI